MALKILVADDSATMRTIYQMTFAGEDAELTVVDGGRRLLEEARRMAPDVVLVDATLPDLDSYTVAESLSQEATLAHVPIIVLASQHHPYDAGRGSSAGVFDHLLKPFDTQALIDKVTAAAAEAHSAHAATPKPAPPQARPVSAPQGLGSPMAATGRGTQVMDRFRERQAPEAAPPAPPRAGQPAAGPASAPRSMSPAPHPPSASAAAPPAPRPAASESRLGAPASRPAAPSFNTPQEPFAAAAGPGGARPVLQLADADGSVPPTSKQVSIPARTPSLSPQAGVAAAAVDGAALAAKLDGLGLTPAQVEGVLALSREVVEQVVWEVVPELAEVLIREEIRRLTA